ncbi:hypothetical protein E7Z59_10235 [Robertkochia marina]|uniref:Uncharacterized protein n=1 Tax=Robertkochia marina TaxID=1227945 RepID=A0A4S3M3E0_9FLAO|nr:hypothetical protein [Robertkochia marina]THD68015.1 hypothetical protein E7Z59_10235 [Robertkochia marina]
MKSRILESILVPFTCVLYLFLKHDLDFFAPVNIVFFILLLGAGTAFHYFVWRALESHVFGTNS